MVEKTLVKDKEWIHGFNERKALIKGTKLMLFAWIYPKRLSCVNGFN